MGRKEDRKRMFQDYGSEFYILRDAGPVSGEYLVVELNAQVTKPFIREHFREVLFQYDTIVETHDPLKFVATQEILITVNVTPNLHAGVVVENAGVLYKCNVSGEITRPSGERSATTYQWEDSWATVKSDAYALLTQGLYGTDLDQEEDIGQLEVQNLRLYVPESYGARALDRYSPTSGENYKIEAIEKFRFPGLVVCQVAEDTR